ncbi:hypothetical protein K6119_16290 [Paracrocinitomix mangrovi]|uniref:hypothetical protein n=1 Tax=Paracrocinitomix mangrovi TaxID=2862509 RepID=UPI001C8DDB61|nr:hypothetical protein [Paracrocinitomix mangrovi]UKN01288.1 hypothetical protein K6119_16290 [Paracrocinitomix mangrovi]
MDLGVNILKFINFSYPDRQDDFIPVDVINNHIGKETQEPLVIFRILDSLYLLENKNLIETTANVERQAFCVRITEKGKNYLKEYSNPSAN